MSRQALRPGPAFPPVSVVFALALFNGLLWEREERDEDTSYSGRGDPCTPFRVFTPGRKRANLQIYVQGHILSFRSGSSDFSVCFPCHLQQLLLCEHEDELSDAVAQLILMLTSGEAQSAEVTAVVKPWRGRYMSGYDAL